MQLLWCPLCSSVQRVSDASHRVSGAVERDILVWSPSFHPFLFPISSRIVFTHWASCTDSSISHPGYNQVPERWVQIWLHFWPHLKLLSKDRFFHTFSAPPILPLSLQMSVAASCFHSSSIRVPSHGWPSFTSSPSRPILEPCIIFSKQADIAGGSTSHPSTSLPHFSLFSSLHYNVPALPLVTLAEFLFLSELLALKWSNKAYGPSFGFVNKVLLGHCPTHLFA